MTQNQQQDNTSETPQANGGEEQTAEKPKLSPLEAIKARQAAMRQNQGGANQRSGGGSDSGGSGGSGRKPRLQQRKMG